MTERCNLTLDIFSAIFDTFIKTDEKEMNENDVEKMTENNSNSTSQKSKNQSSNGMANNQEDNSSDENGKDNKSNSKGNNSSNENETNGVNGTNSNTDINNNDDANNTDSTTDTTDTNSNEDEFDKRFDENPEDVIERVAKQISDGNEAEAEFERNLVNKDITNTPYHHNVSFNINKINCGDKVNYDYIMANLKPISKQATNKVRDAVLQKKRSLTQKRQERGNRLDVNAYVRSKNKKDDTAIFINSKKPSKNPLMAVSVIVDGSDSMSGDRILSAKYSAMIIEDFCRNLSIPFSCISHNTYGSVNINSYVDFDSSNPKKDRYNLTKISTCGCNRDGFAIRYALNKIKYRKEPFKIMIIISDGLPNADNYDFYQAKEDISDIYKECKKKHIELLAFAIGDDVDKLKSLYGENNLVDCRDLNKFPQTISKILAEKSKKIYG